MVMPAPHCFDTGFDRSLRRVEIMIADREHDDPAAGLLSGHGGEVDFPAIFAGRDDA